MKAWALLLGLIHCLLAEHAADGKRYDPSMVDPLMRRSSLDKNFMRFGRSSPAFTEEDEVEDGHDSSPDAETSKEENFLRSMRGKDNFIRFGRARNDNFMRFGRGKQDNYMRFGRARNDNFMRFGRGKQDNYMRFGRGKQDNFMRFGRGKQDNLMRFGRGKQDNFMRFGRGKQDNFMRFGRGKQDNFMRFGRDFTGLTNDIPNVFENGKELDSEILRSARGKQDNFMRFGKSLAGDTDNDIAIAMRSGNSKDSNFIRFGRARQDSFMRLGKSDNDKTLTFNEDSEELKDKSQEKPNYPFPVTDDFTREIKSKDLNLIRFGRQPPTKNDGFIRFGRNSPDQNEDGSPDIELIPQRLKRSVVQTYDSQDEVHPSKLHEESYNHVSLPFSFLPDDLDEEYSTPLHQEDYLNRRKRALAYKPSTPSPFTEEDRSVDYISAKVRFDSPTEPEYQSSLISAGLPNVIVGPEFSLLPDLDPPSYMLKRGRLGDQNFLRLG